uniref:Uncharacterized protein n=1 Tax=Rhizophagus irregularis (strain DAOM 181602 / DAOM 197198 / MUCL 43194) TaxID=747089 RepID=U9T958_RHIID
MVQNLRVTLIKPGSIVSELHYGPYSFYWWIFSDENKTLFLIRLGQQTKVHINEVNFILTIQTGSDNSKLMPMYYCQSGLHVVTESSSTKAISTAYKNHFNTSTRYPGYQAMGWNDKNILEILKKDVDYIPVTVNVGNSESENPIIDFEPSLHAIYPKGYEFSERELGAWQTMLKAAESQHQLWMKSPNGEADKVAIAALYQSGFLTSTPKIMSNATQKFWMCFERALANNKKTSDRKRQLKAAISEEYFEILDEYQQKLIAWMAHHARKIYLNIHVRTNLEELDEEGAVMIVDYKMRILPQSARETKTEFFGKRGWSFHSVLVYTKNMEQNQLDVQVFDHWSNDTRQDAWFTASSLHTVIETLNPKPKWVTIMSDNGMHYHCTELMLIIAHWKEWYNIIPRKWIFLEAGEAKTSIDSHHAQVSQAIKRYIKLGYDVNSGDDIELAVKGIAGVRVSNLNPNRDNGKL